MTVPPTSDGENQNQVNVENSGVVTNGVVVKQSNGFAVASLILGILGFCGITIIPAIILGFIGRSKAKKLDGVGAGQSITGIILGVLWFIAAIAVFVVVSVLGMFVSESVKELSNEVKRAAEEIEKEANTLAGEMENLGNSKAGEKAETEDYEISQQAVDASNGNIRFSGYIKNKTNQTVSFWLGYACFGTNGESNNADFTVNNIEPGGTSFFQAIPDFNEQPSDATCLVSDVLYAK